jgi:hypothetical protein
VVGGWVEKKRPGTLTQEEFRGVGDAFSKGKWARSEQGRELAGTLSNGRQDKRKGKENWRGLLGLACAAVRMSNGKRSDEIQKRGTRESDDDAKTNVW